MRVNFQLVYEIPPGYNFFAVNRNGTMVAFVNPPIRDYDYGEWIDSTNGATGTIVDFDRWDVTLKNNDELRDVGYVGVIRRRKIMEFTKAESKKIKEKEKEKLERRIIRNNRRLEGL